MEIVEKVIEPMLIAGIRICGNYRESGRHRGDIRS
tara:strand:+ start:4147 stop:4251 length:105 start_codon:yes stop_codon:yes gene_type:complete